MLFIPAFKKTATLKLQIPKIGGTAQYGIDAKVYHVVQLRGQGPAFLNVTNMELIMNVNYVITQNNTLWITKLMMEVNSGKTDVVLKDLNGAAQGGQLERYFKSVFRIISPYLWGRVILFLRIFYIFYYFNELDKYITENSHDD